MIELQPYSPPYAKNQQIYINWIIILKIKRLAIHPICFMTLFQKNNTKISKVVDIPIHIREPDICSINLRLYLVLKYN